MRQDRFGTTLVFRSPDQGRIDEAAGELLAFTQARGIEVQEIF
jgi:hypothetical protein